MLSWLAKANVRDPQTVRKLVETRGLCGLHWAELWRRSDRRSGGAVGRALDQIGRAAIEDLAGGEALEPRCPVCASVGRRAGNTLQMILGRFGEPAARSEFASSFGLCQPHLGDALRACRDLEVARALAAIQRTQLERLLRGLEPASGDREAIARAARLVAVKLAGSIRTARTG